MIYGAEGGEQEEESPAHLRPSASSLIIGVSHEEEDSDRVFKENTAEYDVMYFFLGFQFLAYLHKKKKSVKNDW